MSKSFCRKNKQKARKSCERCQNFTEKEKEKKCQHYPERNKNLSEDQKQKFSIIEEIII